MDARSSSPKGFARMATVDVDVSAKNPMESKNPEKSTDYDGFSYSHMEKIASIASGHLDTLHFNFRAPISH